MSIYSILDSYIFVGIVFICIACFFFKKQQPFLLGDREGSKLQKKVNNKKKLANHYGNVFFIYGVTIMVLGILNDTVFNNDLEVLFDFLLYCYLFVMGVIYIKINKGDY